MNTRKLNLITEATTAFPGVSINDAILLFLRNRYSSEQGLSDLIARYLSAISAYSFDGVDDYGVLATRAINPDGDNTFEFWTPPTLTSTPYFIISQNSATSTSAREFSLAWDGSSLSLVFGGQITALISIAQGLKPSTLYGMSLIGNTFRILEGGLSGTLIREASFVRGAVREPSATTRIGARGGDGGSVAGFYQGLQYNIRINGVLWPIQDRNQTIQLPSPSGLGAELLDSSPYVVPAAFTNTVTQLPSGFIANQAESGGTRVAKTFTLPNNAATILVEFDVISKSPDVSLTLFIRDGLTAGGGTVTYTSPSLNVGKQRYIVQNNSTSVEKNLMFSTNVPCTYEVRNISFKPLSVVNSTELVTNGDFSAGTAGWITYSGGSMSVSNGQATLTTTANSTSRFERAVTLEPSAYYEISCDLISFAGNNSARIALIRSGLGNFVTIISIASSTAGKLRGVFLAPASDGIVQIHGDAVNAGTVVVDNVSIRKLDSLCNPLTLVNTTSDRWQEVPQ